MNIFSFLFVLFVIDLHLLFIIVLMDGMLLTRNVNKHKSSDLNNQISVLFSRYGDSYDKHKLVVRQSSLYPYTGKTDFYLYPYTDKISSLYWDNSWWILNTTRHYLDQTWPNAIHLYKYMPQRRANVSLNNPLYFCLCHYIFQLLSPFGWGHRTVAVLYLVLLSIDSKTR